ncbi:hypothetical protein SXCC_04223 [Gluconacetobacter sp. SXCC-1]|nr:hypothetical protein SXCC_04223 [Gluconacetobacter sp. SXCC-1]
MDNRHIFFPKVAQDETSVTSSIFNAHQRPTPTREIIVLQVHNNQSFICHVYRLFCMR